MSKSKSKVSRKRQFLNRLGKVAMTIVSTSLVLSSSASAADAAADAVSSEGGKKALGKVLRVSRSKPALSIATSIVCLAAIPVGGAAASPGLFIACGILVAKTLG